MAKKVVNIWSIHMGPSSGGRVSMHIDGEDVEVGHMDAAEVQRLMREYMSWLQDQCASPNANGNVHRTPWGPTHINQSAPVDARIAKLQAVANCHAATLAEKQTALNLIKRLQAKGQ